MTVFYINAEKEQDLEYQDKYDFAKFIDGRSDVPAETKLKIKKVIGQKE